MKGKLTTVMTSLFTHRFLTEDFSEWGEAEYFRTAPKTDKITDVPSENNLIKTILAARVI